MPLICGQGRDARGAVGQSRTETASGFGSRLPDRADALPALPQINPTFGTYMA